MSVRFQCPDCGTFHQVHDRARGHKVRCPNCSHLVPVVPHEEEDPLASAWQAAETAPLSADQFGDEEADEKEVIILEKAIAPVVWGSVDPADGSSPHVAADSGATTGGNGRPRRVALRPKGALQEAEMDMTPMVDVTFLLLIFFMVTASFAMQKSLNIPQPDTNEPSTQAKSVQDYQDDPDYVVVRLDAYNTYHVSTAFWPDEVEAPSEQELLVKLRLAREGDGRGNIPTKLLAIVNGEALHERVVTAIDAGNDVGMEQVQLLTVDEDE